MLVATVVALYAHNLRYDGEHRARVTMGGADALVQITPYTKAKVGYPDGWMYVRPGETVRGKDGRKHAVRRPVTDVDLTSLLPDGTRIVAAPTSRQSELPSGGTAYLRFLDGDDPLVEGLFPGIDGRAPEKADEAAIRRSMAEELGLLDDGKLQTDASIDARGRDGPSRGRPGEARDLVRRDDGGDRRPLPSEPGGAEGTA